jgi:hypothetical protein
MTDTVPSLPRSRDVRFALYVPPAAVALSALWSYVAWTFVSWPEAEICGSAVLWATDIPAFVTGAITLLVWLTVMTRAIRNREPWLALAFTLWCAAMIVGIVFANLFFARCTPGLDL